MAVIRGPSCNQPQQKPMLILMVQAISNPVPLWLTHGTIEW